MDCDMYFDGVVNGAQEQPLLELNVYCPKVGRLNQQENNWSIDQCKLRVDEQNPCTFDCDIGLELGIKHKTLSSFYLKKREELLNGPVLVLRKKRQCTYHKDPIETLWGSKSKMGRNCEATVSVLGGQSIKSTAIKYELDEALVRRIVNRYCKVANAEAFKACKERKQTFDELIRCKEQFLPFLPVKYARDNAVDRRVMVKPWPKYREKRRQC